MIESALVIVLVVVGALLAAGLLTAFIIWAAIKISG